MLVELERNAVVEGVGDDNDGNAVCEDFELGGGLDSKGAVLPTADSLPLLVAYDSRPRKPTNESWCERALFESKLARTSS